MELLPLKKKSMLIPKMKPEIQYVVEATSLQALQVIVIKKPWILSEIYIFNNSNISQTTLQRRHFPTGMFHNNNSLEDESSNSGRTHICFFPLEFELNFKVTTDSV